MASNRNMPNRGFASMDEGKQRDIARKGGERVRGEKRSFSKDHGQAMEAGRKRGRAFPMRSEASHEIMSSPRRRPARAVNRQAAISPTTMRWGSFAYFAY